MHQVCMVMHSLIVNFRILMFRLPKSERSFFSFFVTQRVMGREGASAFAKAFRDPENCNLFPNPVSCS